MRGLFTLRRPTLVALVICIVLGFASVMSQSQTPSPVFDRSDMLAHLARRVMLPAYLAFEAETVALQRAATALCEAPSMGQLEAAQASWKRAAELWRRSEAFQLGVTRSYAKSIGYWPTRPRRLQLALTSEEPITPAFVEAMGVSAHGLSALEQLLFDDRIGEAGALRAIREGESAKRRCGYLVALTAHLAGRAQAVAGLWRPEQGDFSGNIARAGQGGAAYPTSHQAISEIVNQMVSAVEVTMLKKIGKPLHGNGRKPWPDAVEAGRSGASTALALATLEGAFAIYSGDVASQPGLGFDDFLTALNSALGSRITQQFQAAMAAVQIIQPPLRVAIVEQPQTVRAAYEAVHQLLILLKVDMTNVLSVTVDFSDNDGD